MKIKQLKEKTIKGFVDFLPKIGINNIEGLLNALNDKLSKSEGGEVNKPIVVTNRNSIYSTTINPNGTIYIWDKQHNNNILNIEPYSYSGGIGIDITGRPLRLKNIESINAYGHTTFIGFKVNESAYVYANKFIRNNATNKDVLLGDGSTTDRLIKDVAAGAIQSEYNFNFITTGNINNFVTIKAATSTTAGVMTAADKTKLDNVPNIYAEKSKTISNITVGNRPNKRGLYIDIDYADRTNPGTTVNIPNATTTSDGCMSYEDKAKLDNVLTLLENAAIYVAGEFELAESGIDNTTVVDSPDSIIYDNGTKRFLARKSIICYTHWKADISKNIAPPSRYGIETDDGVFPFNNQMYKFSGYDDIYIATCSNGTCSMKKLTL